MKKILFFMCALGAAQFMQAAMYTFKNNTDFDVAITTKSKGDNAVIFTMGPNEVAAQNNNNPLFGIEANIMQNGKNSVKGAKTQAQISYGKGFEGDGTWAISEKNGNFVIEEAE